MIAPLQTEYKTQLFFFSFLHLCALTDCLSVIVTCALLTDLTLISLIGILTSLIGILTGVVPSSSG
jgi:hypothetical protein